MPPNEFYNDNQLTFFDDKYAYVKKVMYYDKHVEDIVNHKIFLSMQLSNPENDVFFKKMFTLKFLNNQIGYQTQELFASKVTSTFMERMHVLEGFFSDLDNYLKSVKHNESKSESDHEGQNRNAYQDLPQDEINLDLKDTIMKYATNNTIALDAGKNKNITSNDSFSYSLDSFIKMQNVITRELVIFRKNCFLRVI